MSFSADDQHKKRNRMVISCTSCRRKKIKCDRAKPICSSCKARNYPLDQCIYTDTPEAAAAVAAATKSVKGKPNFPRAKRTKKKSEKSGKTDDNNNPPSPPLQNNNDSIATINSEKIKDQSLMDSLRIYSQRKEILEDLTEKLTPDYGQTEYILLKMDLLEKENKILKKFGERIVDSKVGNKDELIGFFQNNLTLETYIKENDLRNSNVLFKPINFADINSIRFKLGRIIDIGPTSFRASIYTSNNFAQIYQFISKLTTKARKQFKSSRRHLDFATYFPFNVDKYSETDTDTFKVYDYLEIKNDQIFLNKLLNFLPNYANFYNHVSIFFDTLLDQLYPIVNKNYVLNIFREVIVKKNLEELSELNDPNKNDFKFLIKDRYRDLSRIAFLISLVKISLLYTDSSFNSINSNLPNSEISKIENILVYFTGNLLSVSKIMKRPLITTVQTLLFMKINRMYHLNEGEGGDSSDGQLLFSLILNMSIMCGIHRNIGKNYVDWNKSDQLMLQKMWDYIMYLDWRQSFDLGYPLSMDNLQFSETSNHDFLTKYSLNITELEINKQFQELNDNIDNNNDEEIYYNFLIPILKNLHYQMTSLHENKLSTFKLEIYLQNLIKFYCNEKIFIPLYESLSNPIIQNNQLPKNRLKFIKFIKKIKIQMEILDIITAIYELIFGLMEKHDYEETSYKVFYSNQSINFVIFIIKVVKKFMEINVKDRFFQVYLFETIKKIIHRSSSFIYSTIIFNSKNGKGTLKINNNLDNLNYNLTNFNDDDFEKICFQNNQYDLFIKDFSLTKQFQNFENFLLDKYNYYNFFQRKIELSNLMFHFFFNIVQKTLKDYYVFYVPYQISYHFYKYLVERNLVKKIELVDNPVEKKRKLDAIPINNAPNPIPPNLLPNISQAQTNTVPNTIPNTNTVSIQTPMNSINSPGIFNNYISPQNSWNSVYPQQYVNNELFNNRPLNNINFPVIGNNNYNMYNESIMEPPMNNLDVSEFNPLDMSTDDFYIDVNDLLNQLNSQLIG